MATRFAGPSTSPFRNSVDGALARWLTYAAALLVVGASVFRFGVLRAIARSAPVPDGLAGRAALVALIAAVVLGLVAAPFGWSPRPGASSNRAKDSRSPCWARCSAPAGVGRGRCRSSRRGSRPRGPCSPAWLRRAGIPPRSGPTAVVLSMPLTGHATGAEQAGAWGYPLDALHLLGRAPGSARLA